MINHIRINAPYVFLVRKNTEDLYKAFVIVPTYGNISIGAVTTLNLNGTHQIEIPIQLPVGALQTSVIKRHCMAFDGIQMPNMPPHTHSKPELTVIVQVPLGYDDNQNTNDPAPNAKRVTTVCFEDAFVANDNMPGDIALNSPYLYLSNPAALNSNKLEWFSGRCIVPVKTGSSLGAHACIPAVNAVRVNAGPAQQSIVQELEIRTPLHLPADAGVSYIDEALIDCNKGEYRDTEIIQGDFSVKVTTVYVNESGNVVASKEPPTTGSLPNQSSDTKPTSFYD